MKRKVNLVGQNTLTISLPSKWVDKNHINKGDELEIEEEGNNLIVGSSRKAIPKKIDVNLTDTNNMIIRTIAAIYKSGYDEVKLYYKNHSELRLIQKAIERTCHTYEIINYDKEMVHVKTISSLDSRDFELIFKRLFFSAIDMGDETLKAIKERDFESMLNVTLMDRNIDKHSDFCRRLMNKEVVNDFSKPMPIYVIVEQTEVMCDFYKRLCQLLHDEKINLSPTDISNLQIINNFVKEFFNGLLKVKISGLSKNMDFVIKLGKLELDIKSKLKKSFKENRNPEAKFLISHIFEVAFEMKSALITSFI
jgi:phosphate uptake regulator